MSVPGMVSLKAWGIDAFPLVHGGQPASVDNVTSLTPRTQARPPGTEGIDWTLSRQAIDVGRLPLPFGA
jgi:hypothetical protein